MLTPQACIFTWIVFSRETFPLLKRCIMEAGRTYQSADREKHSGHWRCSTLFWVGPFSNSPPCREWSLRGNMYFGFQSEPPFQSEAVYYIPASLQYVVWWLRERLHKQAERGRWGALTCRRHLLTFTDRPSSLCAVCLADGVWFLTWFTESLPKKVKWSTCLMSDQVLGRKLQRDFNRVALKFRTDRLSAPQQCLCPHSVSDAMSARLQDSAFKEESKWDLASHPDTARTFFALLISCCARLLRARRFTTTACLFFSVSAVSIAQWHRGSS